MSHSRGWLLVALIVADVVLIAVPRLSTTIEIQEPSPVSVVVRQPVADDQQTDSSRSYVNKLLELTAQDPKLAFTRFQGILNDTPEEYNTCHAVAHQMGHEAFEHFGFQVAMAQQNALCGGGYIHGVVEARFGLMHETDIIAELPTICDETNLSCAHGIGHGLMITTYLDIPVSLNYCDLLPGLSRRNCYDGVWMHIFDLEESGGHASGEVELALTPEYIAQEVERCVTTNEMYKTSCYFYLPRILAHNYLVPFSSYTDLCENVEETYQVTCAAGSGHSVMKYNIADPTVAMDYCEAYRSDLISACKEGASLYYLFADEGEMKCQIFTDANDNQTCNKVSQYRSEL